MRRWPTPMRRARPACPARSSAAIAAPGSPRSIRTSSRHLPVHRRAAGGGAGDPARRHLHPCAEGRQQGQRAGRRHRRHPEGGGAGGQARGGHGRGGRRRFRRPASQSLRAAALDDRRRSRSCRAARIRPTRMAITSRDNAAYLEWDEIAADRDRFREWMEKNVIEVDAGGFRRARRESEERRMSESSASPPTR